MVGVPLCELRSRLAMETIEKTNQTLFSGTDALSQDDYGNCLIEREPNRCKVLTRQCSIGRMTSRLGIPERGAAEMRKSKLSRICSANVRFYRTEDGPLGRRFFSELDG